MGRTYNRYCLEDEVLQSCITTENRQGSNDLLENFNEFKKRTGGKLYQCIKVKIEPTLDCLSFVKEHCPGFDFIPHTTLIKDKRYKNQVRPEILFTYKYFNKIFNSEKEVNKYGIWLYFTIYFDTIFDLLPYFPYEITSLCYNDKHTDIVIAQTSGVENEKLDFFSKGIECEGNYYSYRQKLSKLYRDVFVKYYSDYKERTFRGNVAAKDNQITLDLPLDTFFDAKLYTDNTKKDIIIFKVIDDKTIKLEYAYASTTEYLDTSKLDKVYIEYVYKKEEGKQYE